MRKKRSLNLGSAMASMYSVIISKEDSNISDNMLDIVVRRFFGSVDPVYSDKKAIKYGFYTRDIAETKINEISDFAFNGDGNLTIKCAVEKQISDVDQN